MLTPQPDACPGAVGGLEGAGVWVVAAFFQLLELSRGERNGVRAHPGGGIRR